MKLVIIKEVAELVILWAFFVNTRPRSWPEYFTLDVHYGNEMPVPQWQLNNVPFQQDFR